VVNLEDVLAGTAIDPEIIGNDKVVVPVSGSKSFIKGITDTLRGFVGFATF
jgi:polysaccharide export outer membrane protein